ncbi:MAG: ABC transporter permease [Solimonas sp.]
MGEAIIIAAPRLHRPARHRAQHGLRFALGLPLPALLFTLWWLAARYAWMPPQILPAPSLVWHSAQELVANGRLAAAVAISLERLLWGLAIGVALGLVFGIVGGASRRADDVITPSLLAFAQIPTLAWLPLLMLMLGLGEALKLFLIAKAVVIPVAVHTRTGVRDVPLQLREIAAALRLPRTVIFTRLLLPSALPAIVTGIRLSLGAAWMTLVAVELLASSEGIGRLMVWGRQLFQLDIVFVCIVVIGVLGLGIDLVARGLDAWLTRWPRPALGAGLAASPCGWRARLTVRARNVALPVGVLGLWQYAVASGAINGAVLPSPLMVAHAALAALADGTLSGALGASLLRSFGGLVLGGVPGVALGLMLGLSRRAEQWIAPGFDAFRQIAIFAWVPLLTAWFGIDNLGKLVFISLAAFLPLAFATWRGVAHRSIQLDEVARAARLSFAQRLRLLVLPGAAPSIFAGLRLALVYTWLAAIGVEYFMNAGLGIGSYLLAAQQTFAMPLVLGGMVLVGVLGAALGRLGNALETFATRWRQPEA